MPLIPTRCESLTTRVRSGTPARGHLHVLAGLGKGDRWEMDHRGVIAVLRTNPRYHGCTEGIPNADTRVDVAHGERSVALFAQGEIGPR